MQTVNKSISDNLNLTHILFHITLHLKTIPRNQLLPYYHSFVTNKTRIKSSDWISYLFSDFTLYCTVVFDLWGNLWYWTTFPTIKYVCISFSCKYSWHCTHNRTNVYESTLIFWLMTYHTYNNNCNCWWRNRLFFSWKRIKPCKWIWLRRMESEIHMFTNKGWSTYFRNVLKVVYK